MAVMDLLRVLTANLNKLFNRKCNFRNKNTDLTVTRLTTRDRVNKRHNLKWHNCLNILFLPYLVFVVVDD